MTRIKPITQKATITIEVSFYDDITVDEVRQLSKHVILAAGARLSQGHPHTLRWVARTDVEIATEHGYTDDRVRLD